MDHTAIEIIAAIIVPFLILFLFGIAEQLLERIDYHARLVKISWDSQVFALGAQFGFVVKELLLGHQNVMLFGLFCMGGIGLFTLAIWKLRLTIKQRTPKPTHDDAFLATWLALISLCIPGTYMVLLEASGRTP